MKTLETRNHSAVARLGLAMAVWGWAVTAGAAPRTHDDGLFLRLSGGGGPARTKTGALNFDGATGDINLAIGKVVYPNLAVHATVFGWLVDKPNVKVDGISATANTSLDFTGYGAGVTYYTPQNFFVSPSVGFGVISADGEDLTGKSGTGVGVDLTAGKEWWVSNRWGLGLNGSFGFHNVPGGPDGTFSGWSTALRACATFN